MDCPTGQDGRGKEPQRRKSGDLISRLRKLRKKPSLGEGGLPEGQDGRGKEPQRRKSSDLISRLRKLRDSFSERSLKIRKGKLRDSFSERSLKIRKKETERQPPN